ncbi:hypothetical protein DEU56DRAFT_801054 [Suillus clintonianus]|uniref:uncharacterized protein n=1 Tax=Suillus clintonianus TaxID=1904413 RepID=UPI001B883C71|nr:uncharacterized protein DEU56DRAFT_801054 [Suillus clintonianus]KAG2138956.1 hypothetical protein DEU56DRAFT_801054 [Suillus clintonianus]
MFVCYLFAIWTFHFPAAIPVLASNRASIWLLVSFFLLVLATGARGEHSSASIRGLLCLGFWFQHKFDDTHTQSSKPINVRRL